MSHFDELISLPRRTLALFLIIDTSGSMEGKKIGAVNDAVAKIIPILDAISAENPDAEIKVAALEFSCGVNWLYSELKHPSDFVWRDVKAGGLTSLGAACAELSSKLSRSGYLQSASGYLAPAIILLSDGTPTDDYESGLTKLKGNNWFKVAVKIAIAVGNDADKDVFRQFTGNREAVFPIYNIDVLRLIIRDACCGRNFFSD